MNPQPNAPPARGFTLLEMMTVLAIVGVVLVSTASISGHALAIHRTARSRLESQRAAGTAFGQLRHDLAARLRRAEAPARFTKHPGDDALTLVTQRRGFPVWSASADRALSIASFRVRDHRLERAAAGLRFGADAADRPALAKGTLALLELPAGGPEPPGEDAFETLAPGVFRLEFSFLLDSADSPVRADPPADPRDLRAAVVTVAILDPARRRMLAAAQLDRLAARFPDAEDGELPAARWMEAAASLPARLTDFPLEPLQNVRIRQAMFTFSNAS